MNAQEIADRLDGMRIENVEIQSAAGTENWMAIHQPNAYELPDVISLHSEALLAFCRAVVERVDKVENPCAICHKERGDNLAICTPCKERMTKMRNDPKYRELR